MEFMAQGECSSSQHDCAKNLLNPLPGSVGKSQMSVAEPGHPLEADESLALLGPEHRDTTIPLWPQQRFHGKARDQGQAHKQDFAVLGWRRAARKQTRHMPMCVVECPSICAAVHLQAVPK